MSERDMKEVYWEQADAMRSIIGSESASASDKIAASRELMRALEHIDARTAVELRARSRREGYLYVD